MKNKNKGFTLIELLVVVAIIGILAAVGTVAYTGYTASAKKSTTKANHAAAVKFIAAEDMKCNTGETSVMTKASTPLVCKARTSATVIAAAALSLTDFKNPYDTSVSAVRGTAVSHILPADRGYVNLVATDSNTITVTTCFDDTSAESATDTTCTVAADTVANTIEVGE